MIVKFCNYAVPQFAIFKGFQLVRRNREHALLL